MRTPKQIITHAILAWLAILIAVLVPIFLIRNSMWFWSFVWVVFVVISFCITAACVEAIEDYKKHASTSDVED